MVGQVRGLGSAAGLFFMSGATGLIYEVIWFRRFSHVWGASSLAMAAVVASFLLGLGIGAHFLGRVADRLPKPLLGYAACEALIGLLALLIPLESSLMASISSALYPALHGMPLLHTMVRFLLTFLVLGPPCVLMGGTFPLLVRQFVAGAGDVGPVAGLLYAINTGGAAIGCALAGFSLLPWLGLAGTNSLAAGLNVAIAAAAFLLARKLPALPPETSAPTAAEGGVRPTALYAASALTGLAALLLQMVWTRRLCVLLGGSTYALTSTLFVILLGIGLGSLLYRACIARIPDPARAAALVLGALVLSAGAACTLVPRLSIAVGFCGPLRSLAAGNAAVCFAASAILEFLPALGMGFVFPLLVHLTKRSASDAGRAVGNVYAWNTAGSILGALATGPLGLALLGSSATFALALGLYVVSALLLVPFRGRANLEALATVAVLSAGGIWFAAQPLDPRITDAGMYLYGYRDPDRRTMLYFKEGASCNVSVTERHEDRALAVNGKVDATSSGDMDMQLGIAYFPRFLRPDAKRVLVIGYGSGTTSGASLVFPDTSVTCCEIEPAVYGASQFFSSVNHAPDRKAGFKIVFDDGRSHLAGTPEPVDLILSEPSNPWLAGVASLFTREFYALCRERLGERGVLAQWLQLYSFSEAEYELVIRTVTSSFRHAALLRISTGDSVLLASQAPIFPGPAELDAAQRLVDALPDLKADLAKHYHDTDVRSLLLSRLLLDEAALTKLGARGKQDGVNTDYNLRLEFDAPLRLFNSDLNPETDMDPLILGAVEAPWLRRMIDEWRVTKTQIRGLRSLAALLLHHNRESAAVEVLGAAVALDGQDAGLRADRALAVIAAGDGDLDADMDALLKQSVEEALRVVKDLKLRSKDARAAEFLERIVALRPESATAWGQLASTYESLKQNEKAGAAHRKAVALDPLNRELKRNLEDFEKKKP